MQIRIRDGHGVSFPVGVHLCLCHGDCDGGNGDGDDGHDRDRDRDHGRVSYHGGDAVWMNPPLSFSDPCYGVSGRRSPRAAWSLDLDLSCHESRRRRGKNHPCMIYPDPDLGHGADYPQMFDHISAVSVTLTLTLTSTSTWYPHAVSGKTTT